MAHKSDSEIIAGTHNTARFFAEHRHVSWVLFVLTIAWGMYAYASMPKRKDPEIPVRVAAAILSWPGATAEDMEQRVTRLVEGKLAESSKVEKVESNTRAGVSVVTVLLDQSVDDTGKEFDDIWLKLSAMQGLPEGASIKFIKDFGDTATLMLSVASPRVSEIEVQLRAREIADAINRVRQRVPPDVQGSRATLIAAFPTTLDDRDFGAIAHDLARWAQSRGARDVRIVRGPGYLGVDSQTSATDERILSGAIEHVGERLRASEIHPDAWRLTVIRDTQDAFAQLGKVAGEKYSYRELDRYSEALEEALRGVPEVARVSRAGVVSDVVYLDYSQEQLAAYSVGPQQIKNALAARNIAARGGVIDLPNKSVLIAPSGELGSEADIGGIVITKSASGEPVYLRDLVTITRAYETPSYLAFSTYRDPSGQWQRTRAIALSITMKSGLQIADFAEAVEARIGQARTTLPEDLVIERVSDQPQQVAENVDLFMSSLFEAIVLVVLVALVGFWEWRSALLMALSIPITLAITFGLMHLLGIDVQQISIASLIIALGLLVDDPVVAGDAIKRELGTGLPRKIAAWLGPTKLATAILFATITNIVAYLPFLTLTGDTSRFIFSLPVVLTASLVASRIVSMSFIPLLGYYLLRPDKKDKKQVEQSKQGSGFRARYSRVVRGAIRHRWLVLAGSAALFVIGCASVRDLKQAFFPKDLSYLSYVDVWLPEDSPVSATRRTADGVERIVRQVGDHHLQSVTTFVGGGGPRFWFSINPEQRQSNYAQLIMRVKDKHHTSELVGRLQDALASKIPGARIDVREIESGPGVGMPIAIRVSGEDKATLRSIAEKLETVLHAQPHAERIRDTWGADNFTVALQIDPDRASAARVTNQDVSSSTASALGGARVGQLQEGNHQVPIVARLRASERQQLSDVENLYVQSSSDPTVKVPLRQIGGLGFESATGKIVRRNHVRTITVGAYPARGHLPSEVLARALPEIERIERELPPGYSLVIGGEHEKQVESFKELVRVLAISITAIFLALVFQFRNAIKPLIVFAAIPFGVIASLISLRIMDAPFGFMAFLGVISLIGVIVSHVIVLFDFIEEQHEAGADFIDALIDAGVLRLRPVLVTVGATVLGLVPLAIHGGPLWEPLCYVQIGGLTTATIITLVLVPVIYAVFVLDLKIVRWSHEEPAQHASAPSAALQPLAAAAVLIAALGSSGAVAQPVESAAPAAALTGKAGGLTAEHIARSARRTSPTLREKQLDIEAAQADLDRAVIDYFPRLQVSNSITRYNDIDSSPLGSVVVAPGAQAGPLEPDQPLSAAPIEIDPANTVKSMSATLTIPISEYLKRLGPAHAAAEASVAAAQDALHVQEHKTAYDARALYYAWVQAELEAAVAVQNLDLSKEHLARVKALANADSASEADVASVEANVAGAELVVVQARNLVVLQRERIAIAMHDAAHKASSYQIGEDFSEASAEGLPASDPERLVRQAYEQRPELSALRSQVIAYDEQAESLRAQAFPRLNAVGQVGLSNPDPRRLPQEDEFRGWWSVGLQMTYAPNDTASSMARASATAAKARALEAQQLAMRDAIRAEVIEAVLSYRNANANIEISTRRLAAAETAYRARRERFLVDMATTVELSEAQTELFRARLDAVQAQVAIRLAHARLAYVTGASKEG